MRISRALDVVSEMAGDRAILLDSTGAELITLNPVGSLIWNAIEGEASAADLATMLAGHFPQVSESELRADVDEFIEQLRTAGLVVVADAHH